MYYITHYAITHYKFSKFDKKISGHKACKIFRCQTPEIKLEFDVVFPPGLNQSAFMAKLAERDDVLTVSK